MLSNAIVLIQNFMINISLDIFYLEAINASYRSCLAKIANSIDGLGLATINSIQRVYWRLEYVWDELVNKRLTEIVLTIQSLYSQNQEFSVALRQGLFVILRDYNMLMGILPGIKKNFFWVRLLGLILI